MLKTLLAATTALSLVSGIAHAQVSRSTTESTNSVVMPSHDADVTRTTRKTTEMGGVKMEQERTSTGFDEHRRADRDDMKSRGGRDAFRSNKDFHGDRDAMRGDREKTMTRDSEVTRHGDMTVQKDRTISKGPDFATRSRTETTTIR